MTQKDLSFLKHDHTFNQDQKRSGEPRTLAVVIMTAVMMIAEIVIGTLSGSMALLADGLHMASHASALGINLFAYHYARRHAQDHRFSFGTGKVNALGGFTGAVLLAGFACVMAWKSLERMMAPVEILYGQAILVAVIGLIVNGISVVILQTGNHSHPHGGIHHAHSREHEQRADHNLQSAYLHVMADALTSFSAIFALLAAKYLHWVWMDPLMGIAGAVLILRWSKGLLRTTSHVLLDQQGPEILRQKIQAAIESDGDSRITDLHLWSIGPNIYSTLISVAAHSPKEPDEYKKILPDDLGLVHVTIEVSACRKTDLSPARTLKV